MLINWAKDDSKSDNGAHASSVSSGYRSHEYQTASELFDYMSRHHNFDVEANNPLSTRDLVILYENIEIGTKLLSHAKQVKRRLPNQLVETIVYNEDGSDSEVGENYSNEDLLHICRTNNETMDILNGTPVFENTLCHKKGNMKLKNNHLNSEYDKYFLLNDSQFKKQLRNIKLTARECENVFPTSLLDYLSCKRLEDNYNIYMDNIIRYVTNTIEQLKRISNGDYLTEKAKRKWREVPETKRQINKENDMKILATSTSFPLCIETKLTGIKSMWDDIVHSEMDIKSLTKLLEKKIIIEVPKLICSSYTLLSKQCADNLIISCESRDRTKEDKESRVDVVLQLERSKSGQIVSNINSIMIVQASTSDIPIGCTENAPLALPYNETNDAFENGINLRTLAIEDIPSDNRTSVNEYLSFADSPKDKEEDEESEYESENEQNDLLEYNDYEEMASSLPIVSSATDSTTNINELTSHSEGTLLPTDSTSSRLYMTMQYLEVLDTLPEEEEVKKKSPAKVRIKSPYANNSHVIEEKKRKKLLEIKERREKRKMAFNESCKISKNKYAKGTTTPQAANSVTKLSITNKSFYNSIYGHFTEDNNRFNKKSRDPSKKDSIPEIPLEVGGGKKNVLSPEKNSLKFIDRSYYLDHTVTAMDLQKKQIRDRKPNCPPAESGSTKLLNMNILTDFIESFSDSIEKVKKSQIEADTKVDDSTLISDSTISAEPCSEDLDLKSRDKTIVTLDCRKSIEKIYSLMNKTESKPIETILLYPDCMMSDSVSSIPLTKNKSSEPTSNKRLIITKEQDKNRSNMTPQTRNPLKAISQLLHEFENVKKNRKKVLIESKGLKRQQDVQKDPKFNIHGHLSRRRPQTDEQIDEKKHTDRFSRSNLPRDKRVNKSTPNVDSGRTMSPYRTCSPKRNVSPKKTLMSPRKVNNEDTNKRIADLIDEVKEAKGEAVKGPPRLNNARLNALAQPKKCYVVAHSEEYQSKYGRNLMADRLDRLAAATDRHNVRNRLRRFGNEPLSSTLQKTHNANQPLDARKRSSPRTISPTKQNSGIANARDTIKVINVEETKTNLKRELVVPLDQYTRPIKLSSVKEEPTTFCTPHVPQDWKPNKLLESQISSLVDESQGSSLTNSSDMGHMIHKLINKIIKTDFVETSGDEPCSSLGRKTESLLGTDCDDFEYTLTETTKATNYESCRKNPLIMKNTESSVTTVMEYLSDSSHSHHVSYESSLIKDEDDTVTTYGTGGIDKELQKLEHALAKKKSNCTFQNRLRMKTLTLTPIQSSQHTMIVESGDGSSLTMPTKSLQILEVHSRNTFENSISDGTVFDKQIRSNFSWEFAGTQIPMQLYTVGYAIPQYSNQIEVHPMEVRRIRSNVSCKTDEINKEVNALQIKPSNHRFENFPKIEFLEKDNEISSSSMEIEPKDGKIKELEIPIKIASSHEHPIKILEPEVQVTMEQEQCTNVASFYEQPTKILEPEAQATVQKEQRNNDGKELESCSEKQIIEKTNQSNSLDILVGLLNEIKQLTECQTHITENDNIYKKKHQHADIVTPKQQQESVENIFNNASKFNNRRDWLLVHQVDTDTSLEIQNDWVPNIQPFTKKLSLINIENQPAIYIDKKVSVDLIGKDLVNRTTDIPSQFFDITVTRSTAITQSMINLFEQSVYCPRKKSSESLFSTESLIPSEKIIELQDYDYETDGCKKTNVLKADATKDANEIQRALGKTTDIQTQERLDTTVAVTCDVTVPTAAKQVSKTHRKPTGQIRTNTPLKTGKRDQIAGQARSVVKLKRDVLVTMYCILVVTVFTALSLPQLSNVTHNLF